MVKAEAPKEMIVHALALTDNVGEAAKLLEDWAQKNNELMRYLTEPFLKQACYEAVRTECRDKREKIWTAPNYTKGGNGHRVMNHAVSLMDFPLPNGKRLQDAKRSDLLEATEFYSKQAKNMQHKSNWLQRIAERVGRKTVKNAFSEEELAKLKEETGF